MVRRRHVAPLILLATAAAPSARAAFLLNQVGSSPSHFDGASASPSQEFESGYSRFTSGVVDDFVAPTSQLYVTNVSAVLLGFNGMANYNAVSGYRVEVYSSASAATSDLYGDVGHAYVSPSSVSLTVGYDASPYSALVSIPVDLQLGSAGKYFVSVIPIMAFVGNGQIGVYASTGFGGGNDAFVSNPGGGLGYANGVLALGGDAAYSVSTSSVSPASPLPEPAMATLPAIAVGTLLARRPRRTARR